MHCLLFYEKAPDFAQRQEALQPAHAAHLAAAVGRGELVLGGSLADPVDGSALLVFAGESPAAAEAFAAADPYVVHGIVVRWQVRRWDTVVGTALLATEAHHGG